MGGGRGGCDGGVESYTYENRYIWKKKRKEKKRKGGTQPKFELPTFSLEIPCSNHYAIVVFSGFFFCMENLKYFLTFPSPLTKVHFWYFNSHYYLPHHLIINVCKT